MTPISDIPTGTSIRTTATDSELAVSRQVRRATERAEAKATRATRMLDKRAETFSDDEKVALAELVNLPALQALVQKKLFAAGRDPAEMRSWTNRGSFPMRLSKKDYDGRSPDGPENQMDFAAEMCVMHNILPVFLLLELQSAFGNKSPRTAFHSMLDAIVHGDIDCNMVCPYHADRIARDDVVGVHFMGELKKARIGLHETKNPTRIFSLDDDDEWAYWVRAIAEARKASADGKRRSLDHGAGKARKRELISPIDRVFGYEPNWQEREVRVGRHTLIEEYQKTADLDVEESPHLAEAIQLLLATARGLAGGETSPDICRAKNLAGIPWRVGKWTSEKLWPAVTHPRVAGLQVNGTDATTNMPNLVDAPIPALISNDERLELVALRERSRLNEGSTAWSSNLLSNGIAVCGTCDANLQGGGTYYRCPNGTRAAPHTCPPKTVLEDFVKVAARLAYRQEFTAERDAQLRGNDPVASLEGERLALRTRLHEYEVHQDTVAAREREKVITSESAGRQLAAIAKERKPIELALAALAGQTVARNRFTANPAKATKTLEGGNVADQRRIIQSVIKRVVVERPTHKLTCRDHERHFRIEWADGVTMPEEAIAKLATEMLMARKTDVRASGKMATCGPVAEAALYELWQKGNSNPQIADELNRREIPTAQRRGEWTSALVASPLKRTLKERGLPYTPHRGSSVKYAEGVLTSVYSMVVEKGREREPAAKLLNAMKKPSPSGKPWTPRMVQWAVLAARESRGEVLEGSFGRPRALPPEVLADLDALQQEGMSYPALATYLNDDMHLTTATGMRWDRVRVHRTLKSYRARKAAEQRVPAGWGLSDT